MYYGYIWSVLCKLQWTCQTCLNLNLGIMVLAWFGLSKIAVEWLDQPITGSCYVTIWLTCCTLNLVEGAVGALLCASCQGNWTDSNGSRHLFEAIVSLGVIHSASTDGGLSILRLDCLVSSSNAPFPSQHQWLTVCLSIYVCSPRS